jgi:hypothetical protein
MGEVDIYVQSFLNSTPDGYILCSKCDGTRAETKISSFGETDESISIIGACHFSRLLAEEVCASAVVMLDTPCSEVV